jgi:aminoglycoside phosphotransferase (APT) family kinase protein
MEALIGTLPGAVPADDGRVALVHGDFRIDNLIWSTPGRSPSALGRSPSAPGAMDGREGPSDASPNAPKTMDGRERPAKAAEDPQQAARIAAIVDWELSTLGHPFADIAYFSMALRLPRNPVLPGLAGIDRAALGIPAESALVERFAAATGLDPLPHWNFLLAFQFFRLAAIAQGVLKRALQGNASSEQALAAGRMTRTIATLGAELI